MGNRQSSIGNGITAKDAKSAKTEPESCHQDTKITKHTPNISVRTLFVS
jgi:hypothetical protein